MRKRKRQAGEKRGGKRKNMDSALLPLLSSKATEMISVALKTVSSANCVEILVKLSQHNNTQKLAKLQLHPLKVAEVC